MRIERIDLLVLRNSLIRPFSTSSSRRDELLQDVPAGLGRLFAVVGVDRAGALAPADQAVRIRFDDDVLQVVATTRASRERSNQAVAKHHQVDPFDAHGGHLLETSAGR